MKTLRHTSIFFLLTIILSACGSKNVIPEGFTAGTIKDMTGLDGCRYLIELENGEFLQPVQLNENLQKDGLKVVFKYAVDKKVMSTCMKGKVVRVSEIKQQ